SEISKSLFNISVTNLDMNKLRKTPAGLVCPTVSLEGFVAVDDGNKPRINHLFFEELPVKKETSEARAKITAETGHGRKNPLPDTSPSGKIPAKISQIESAFIALHIFFKCEKSSDASCSGLDLKCDTYKETSNQCLDVPEAQIDVVVKTQTVLLTPDSANAWM
ncbi:hypothetical protein TNCT_270981, partial [Trichonephila clavata]